MTAGDEFIALVDAGDLDLSAPATGATPERLRRLFEIARRDVAVARLGEAHTDALAILHEAGRHPDLGARYGVWAADDPTARLELIGSSATGPLRVHGTKPFCTGLGLVDRALVTVRTGDGVILLDLDVRQSGSVTFDTGAWVATAFGETNTGTTTFDAHRVEPSQIVGEVGWYLDRPGFWHGACGPAACWAGGAAGLVDWVEATSRTAGSNPHRDAHLGALVSLRWRMTAVLDVAGREIDRCRTEQPGAMIRALMLRHDIERAATEVIDRTGRAAGPRPFAFDAEISRRIAEVQLYIRQCHAERDLEALGRVIREQPNDAV